MPLPQDYIDRSTAELKELYAEGQIDREYLDEQIRILNDPDDPLGGGYGLCLPVAGNDGSLCTTFLSRKQFLDHDIEGAIAETQKQLQRYGATGEDSARIIERTVEIWRKLNAVERKQAS